MTLQLGVHLWLCLRALSQEMQSWAGPKECTGFSRLRTGQGTYLLGGRSHPEMRESVLTPRGGAGPPRGWILYAVQRKRRVYENSAWYSRSSCPVVGFCLRAEQYRQFYIQRTSQRSRQHEQPKQRPEQRPGHHGYAGKQPEHHGYAGQHEQWTRFERKQRIDGAERSERYDYRQKASQEEEAQQHVVYQFEHGQQRIVIPVHHHRTRQQQFSVVYTAFDRQ